MKLFKINDKEVILKASKGKERYIPYRRAKIRMTSDFCLETMQANGEVFKYWKENCQIRVLYPEKISFK